MATNGHLEGCFFSCVARSYLFHSLIGVAYYRNSGKTGSIDFWKSILNGRVNTNIVV